jgi:hypothetical protein
MIEVKIRYILFALTTEAMLTCQARSSYIANATKEYENKNSEIAAKNPKN